MESLWAKDDSGWHWVDTGGKAPRDWHPVMVTSHCHWTFTSQSTLIGAEPHQVHNLQPCDTCKKRWLAAYWQLHPRAHLEMTADEAARWVRVTPGAVWHWASDLHGLARVFDAACGYSDTYNERRLSMPTTDPVCSVCIAAVGAEAPGSKDRDPFEDDLL